MANNVNTNLTQRLFAYIQHRDDLTTAMTEVYKNSLIFVGDQRQIYVPLYNAYVGIGMDNYNAVVNRVSTVEQGLADLKQKSTVGVVTGAYVQRTADLPDGLAGDDIVGNKLGGDILFTANGNYDENSGWAYEHNLVYLFNTDSKTGSWTTTGGIKNNTNATSGIRLSYYINYVNDTVDGVPVSRPAGHRIVIDDTMTWSYMTHAYTYSLNFTRDYTNTRIETLYHDLLGEPNPVLVPVPYDSMFTIDPTNGNQTFIPGNYYYWNGTGEAKMPEIIGTGENANLENDAWISTNPGWAKLADNTTPTSGTQYYKLSSGYDNTYNMNIADGIQTLKEVAYILDQLSDGGLGSYTYISKTQWTDAGNTWTLVAGESNAYTSTDPEYAGTYFRVITASGNPTTSEKNYAYYVKVNPENLGIQMAYSIAGNTADINDLHEHVELAEAGKTTTRSMSYINTANLATVSQWSHTELSITDTDESLPSVTYNGQSAYIIGDVISTVSLDLANTYLTYSYAMTVNDNVYTVSNISEVTGVINDAERVGVFQKVNFVNDLPDFVSGTYYNYDSTAHTMTLQTNKPDGWPKTRQQAVEWGNNNNYYWMPGDAYDYANATFEKTTAEHFAEHHTANDHYYTKDANGHYTYVTEPTAANVADYYVMTDDGEYYAQHAIIDTANHIATTAWVDAYYKDNQAKITEQINDILDDAKEYTDQEIGKLDNNLKNSYGEFATWMENNNHVFTEVPGTADSTTEHNAYWTQYLTEASATKNKYDSAYVANKLRSQYISNIVETDGVVEITETTELPTDQLEITNTVWNSQQSKAGYKKVTEVTEWPASADDSLNDADSAIEDVSEQLFTFVYNNGKTPRQIYYHSDTAVNNEYVYVELTSGTDTAGTSDYILNNDGTYSQLDTNAMADAANIIDAFNNPTTKSAYWRQVYKKQTPYYEVKTSTISYVAGADNDTISFIGLDGTEHSIVIASNTNKLYVKNGATTKVEYLTGSVAHYDYTYAGGEGQNKVTLNVNITNVEDSTPTNRGFADSYDVKEYIENIFSWVNLSANVSQSAFESTAAFYNIYDIDVKVKNYTDDSTELPDPKTADQKALDEAYALIDKVYGTDAKPTGNKLYYKNTNDKYEAINTKSAARGYIRKLQRTAAGVPVASGGVAGSDFYTISMASGQKTPVYTTEQSVVVNPINMVATKVHD